LPSLLRFGRNTGDFAAGRAVLLLNRVNGSLPIWLRQVTYNLHGGFLVRPFAIALTLGCAGGFLSSLEESWPPLSASHVDPQVAQIILGGIAASIMTVLSIVSQFC
jgi:hypothetical protein